MGAAEMTAAARSVGLSGAALTQAVAYGLAESGGDQHAVNHNSNGTTDYGWWQINSIHGYDGSRLLNDPLYQAQAMAKLSKNGTDWGPWYASKARVESKVSEANGVINATPADWGLLPGTVIPLPGLGGGNPLSDIKDLGGDLKGVLKAVGEIASHLLDPKWWLRIGQGLAAVVLLVLALGLIFRKQAFSAALLAATKGRKAA